MICTHDRIRCDLYGVVVPFAMCARAASKTCAIGWANTVVDLRQLSLRLIGPPWHASRDSPRVVVSSFMSFYESCFFNVFVSLCLDSCLCRSVRQLHVGQCLRGLCFSFLSSLKTGTKPNLRVFPRCTRGLDMRNPLLNFLISPFQCV